MITTALAGADLINYDSSSSWVIWKLLWLMEMPAALVVWHFLLLILEVDLTWLQPDSLGALNKLRASEKPLHLGSLGGSCWAMLHEAQASPFDAMAFWLWYQKACPQGARAHPKMGRRTQELSESPPGCASWGCRSPSRSDRRPFCLPWDGSTRKYLDTTQCSRAWPYAATCHMHTLKHTMPFIDPVWIWPNFSPSSLEYTEWDVREQGLHMRAWHCPQRTQ